jgi:predicted Zn finger-like uncharacterized protein
MIIECNGCSRKFRLDEALLKPEGSKVRCTKCGAIFVAVPPAAAADRPTESDHGSDVPEREAPRAAETEWPDEKRKPRRIALSVPVSCISIDGEDRPLNFYIGLITEVGPSDLSVEVFCSTVPHSVLVSFINLENRDVQIKAAVTGSETTPSRKTKLELAFVGSQPEISDFIAQLVKSYHYPS